MFSNLTLQNALLWGSVYGAVVVIAAWISMVIWAYRDIRARSRDVWLYLLVGAIVLVLNFPGLLIYLFLRPRETLAEAYERSLEEEALLQEIEEKPTCPGCGQRVEHDWQACPYCHTRLKKPCIQCGKMLQLAWEICPHCATQQTSGVVDNTRSHVSRKVRRPSGQPTNLPDEGWTPQDYNTPAASKSGSLEFVDEDY